MPATPVQAEGGSKARTLTSKKMPVQDYPVLWWSDPPTQPPRSPHVSTLDPSSSTSSPEAWLPFTLGDCGLPYTCTFSNDRERLSKRASVVLFAGSKLDSANMPSIPRNETQAWVLNEVLEPLYGASQKQDLDALPFTHSWSHMFESDFVETVFGTTILNAVTAPPKISLQEKNRLRALGKDQGGKAPAAWIVLNSDSDVAANVAGECVGVDAPSGRESYVKELQKLMDIDIYDDGGCLKNTAWPVHEDTQKPWTAEEIMRQYKFVFALERVNCQDYVTRTLADALTAGAVPIVDGPRDYSRFLPIPNAFVQMNTFISPELLAQELDAMDRDDALYQQRLTYRTPMADPGSQQQAPSSVDSGPPSDQALLSPLFLDTFSPRPSKDVLTAAGTKGAGSLPDHHQAEWEPNRHGAYCGICQLAHDLAEKQYDWKTHMDRVKNRKVLASSSSSGAVCESVPRYLPGLPAQMAAYDEYLQKEHLQQGNHEESKAGLKENHEEGAKSAKVQSVKVTVDIDPHKQPPSGTLSFSEKFKGVSSSSSSAIVYHGQEQFGPEEELLSLRAGSSHPSLNAEMYFVLLLIVVLSVGALAVAWVTSKNARRLMSWPWRRLYYSKVPQDVSLERIMLDELGEDLLYD